ncbi:epoxyqueuosine reductase QueH [Patescibacteria group bacterium]
MKPKLLLHICCAPCAGNILKELEEEFDLTVYFYNPNLDSKEEHQKRLFEAEKYCEKLEVDFIKSSYDHKKWLKIVKGLENEPEGGKRCKKCFEMRLKEVARFAKENDFNYFSTTLTVSPYKSVGVISPIGKMMANKFGVKFLDRDFAKKDGFKKSLEVSKKEEFYRQNYCGCEFSK